MQIFKSATRSQNVIDGYTSISGKDSVSVTRFILPPKKKSSKIHTIILKTLDIRKWKTMNVLRKIKFKFSECYDYPSYSLERVIRSHHKEVPSGEETELWLQQGGMSIWHKVVDKGAFHGVDSRYLYNQVVKNQD